MATSGKLSFTSSTVMTTIITLQVLFALIICLFSRDSLSPLSRFHKQRGDDDSMIYFGILAAGTLCWPLLWHVTIGFNVIEECKLLFIPLLWPIFLGIIQLYDSFYDRCEDVGDHQQQRSTLIGGIQTDTATVISFAFASATLFWAMGGKQNSLPSVRIVIIALLLCIGLIVPTYSFMDNNQRYTSYARVTQRVFVNYSMGLIMTALVMAFSNCTTQVKLVADMVKHVDAPVNPPHHAPTTDANVHVNAPTTTPTTTHAHINEF